MWLEIRHLWSEIHAEIAFFRDSIGKLKIVTTGSKYFGFQEGGESLNVKVKLYINVING